MSGFFERKEPRGLTRAGLVCAVILVQVCAMSFLVIPAGQAAQNPGVKPKAQSLAPSVETVLDRIERADSDLKDLQAKIKYSVVQLLKASPSDPDEVENYFGTIKYLKRTETTQFYIHFEKWNDGTLWMTDPQQWYIFDGEWLTTAKENGRTIEREQIVRPGEKTDLFKLGRGPFPLPFGQSKADMLEQFDVRLVPPSGDDPQTTDHLICNAKPDSKVAERFERIELFVSNDAGSPLLGLPVQIIAYKRDGQTRETVAFEQIKKNKGLKPKRDFALPTLTRKWEMSERPLSSNE